MISIIISCAFIKYLSRMSFELLQLFALIVVIGLGFKYFFLGSTFNSAPATAPSEDSKKSEIKKQQIKINQKYSTDVQSIDQVQGQSSEQGSLMLPKKGQQSINDSQVKLKAQALILNFIQQTKEDNLPAQTHLEERPQILNKIDDINCDSSQHPSQTDLINASEITFLKDISQEVQQQKPSNLDSNIIKLHQVSEDPRQKKQQEHNFEVKDVVSECGEFSNAQEVHSNAYRIEVSQMQSKRKNKLKIVKYHYKSIIQNLKKKLEEACIRHNESLESDINNQTITFSEEQSSFFHQHQNAELEVKVEEVATLRDELMLHEQILTTMIEQDIKLKDKVRILEAQNSQLKATLQNSIINPHQDISRLGLSGVRSDYIVQSQVKSDKERDSRLQARSNEQMEGVQKVESRIMQLYVSQLMGSSQMKSSILSYQGIPRQSTISMMSLIEGVMNIALLGQCRFLNQISKKFVIGQIKKFKKEKVSSAQPIYSFEVQGGDYNTSLYSVLSSSSNLLIIIKLQNLVVGIFTDRIFNEDEQCQEQSQNQYLFLNLTKRKAYRREGVCFYQDNQIKIGYQGQSYLSEFPPFVFYGESQPGLAQINEKVTNVTVFRLGFE